jgi:hypothetical protein
MIDLVRELVKPLISDESVLMVSIYRIDGTPVFVESKNVRGVLEALYWLEKQIQTLIHFISSGLLGEAEFRFRDYYVMLQPISRTLVLGILSSEEASAYKLRIDTQSVIENLRRFSNEV